MSKIPNHLSNAFDAEFEDTAFELEAAFRRGYHHGYLLAIRMMDDKEIGRDALWEHEEEIKKWRNNLHNLKKGD